MDLVIASTFNKDSESEWAQWNVDHVVTHNRLFDSMVKAGHLPMNYPIDMEARPDDNWKQIHYQMHQSLYSQLGLGSVPFDMSDVSFDDEDEFQDWHLLHALVHQTLNRALGLL